MKKYLMMGAAALTMGFAFVSCSSDDNIYNPDAQSEKVVKNFEQAFVQAFGQPAPNQDWGFGTTTRGITRGQNDNSCGTCIKPDMTDYPKDIAPNPITPDEAAYVKKWFEENPGFTEGRDFHNFFIQQVYGKADKEYNVWYNHYDQNHNPQEYRDDYVEKGTMDYFCVGDGTNYTHPLDFNSNDCGTKWKTVYMQNSSALSFKTHMSWSSEEWKFFKCAKINVPGVGEGWYVGMCMYGEKYDNGDRIMNKDMKDLEYADDWIVKIVPADPVDYKDVADYRVIAEDLPTSVTDFDYNDVVFDVYYNQNDDTKAKIQLIAAGATLQITVNGSDVTEAVAATQNEVHSLFGVGASEMVNTGLKSATAEAFEVTIDKEQYDDGIRIMVNKGTQEEPQWFTLNAFKGEPAAKIKVDHDYDYCSERQDIVKKYPRFADYVSDLTIKWYPAE